MKIFESRLKHLPQTNIQDENSSDQGSCGFNRLHFKKQYSNTSYTLQNRRLIRLKTLKGSMLYRTGVKSKIFRDSVRIFTEGKITFNLLNSFYI